jgi:rod shape-determining protein MreB
MGLGMDIGIDLGTATVLIYVKGKGVVLSEPSVVAINSRSGKVLAVGESASLMLGRTPGIVDAIRPLRDGVMSDFKVTEVRLKACSGRVSRGLRAQYFKPTIVVWVPSVSTPGEQKALKILQARGCERCLPDPRTDRRCIGARLTSPSQRQHEC